MKIPETGHSGQWKFETDKSHSAVRYGNEGVDVIATPALIGMIELACHRLILQVLEPGEASVGVHVDCTHVRGAVIGLSVTVSACITEVAKNQITFEVSALHGDIVLMQGRHTRAIVDLDRLKRGLVKPAAAMDT
ncbi:thioesterase family protein [Oricola indica]|uniref:thioesterase family protein n=1 Tax=Oricola indica TaxID=2872591 RepID=UPI003CCB8161